MFQESVSELLSHGSNFMGAKRHQSRRSCCGAPREGGSDAARAAEGARASVCEAHDAEDGGAGLGEPKPRNLRCIDSVENGRSMV